MINNNIRRVFILSIALLLLSLNVVPKISDTNNLSFGVKEASASGELIFGGTIDGNSTLLIITSEGYKWEITGQYWASINFTVNQYNHTIQPNSGVMTYWSSHNINGADALLVLNSQSSLPGIYGDALNGGPVKNFTLVKSGGGGGNCAPAPSASGELIFGGTIDGNSTLLIITSEGYKWEITGQYWASINFTVNQYNHTIQPNSGVMTYWSSHNINGADALLVLNSQSSLPGIYGDALNGGPVKNFTLVKSGGGGGNCAPAPAPLVCPPDTVKEGNACIRVTWKEFQQPNTSNLNPTNNFSLTEWLSNANSSSNKETIINTGSNSQGAPTYNLSTLDKLDVKITNIPPSGNLKTADTFFQPNLTIREGDLIMNIPFINGTNGSTEQSNKDLLDSYRAKGHVTDMKIFNVDTLQTLPSKSEYNKYYDGSLDHLVTKQIHLETPNASDALTAMNNFKITDSGNYVVAVKVVPKEHATDPVNNPIIYEVRVINVDFTNQFSRLPVYNNLAIELDRVNVNTGSKSKKHSISDVNYSANSPSLREFSAHDSKSGYTALGVPNGGFKLTDSDLNPVALTGANIDSANVTGILPIDGAFIVTTSNSGAFCVDTLNNKVTQIQGAPSSILAVTVNYNTLVFATPNGAEFGDFLTLNNSGSGKEIKYYKFHEMSNNTIFGTNIRITNVEFYNDYLMFTSGTNNTKVSALQL